MKVKVHGFIFRNSFPRSAYRDFVNDMSQWLAEGKIHYEELVIECLENSPTAFNDILLGKNYGTIVVRVN
jgi:alcohol dehydrogenase